LLNSDSAVFQAAGFTLGNVEENAFATQGQIFGNDPAGAVNGCMMNGAACRTHRGYWLNQINVEV
jgi:hypothetical protein